MRMTVVLISTLMSTAPAWATPCGTHIATIERRLESSGAAKVTGAQPDPAADSHSPMAAGPAPTATNAAQRPSAVKIAEARGMIATAKKQDQAGDQTGCEASMTEATKTIGALP